jgi:hypothetical protein
MPIYAAGPRPATVMLARTSSQCIKDILDRYLPLASSATKPGNSVANATDHRPQSRQAR